MKINIFNDFDVRYYEPTGKYPVLIRALNPYYQQIGVPYSEVYLQSYRAVLDVYVDDVREETEQGKCVFKLFNEEMANEIREFVLGHSFDECVVHCSYGESRSPAIAIGVAHLLKKEEVKNELLQNPNYKPNELILKYLLK